MAHMGQPGDCADQTWAVETTKADVGALEDYVLTVDSNLSPTLSSLPQHVFRRP
ncbi:MAG: hypothetical protein ACC645_20830 [Pirellulales bacterium]